MTGAPVWVQRADRYDPATLLESCGMTAEGIAADVRALLGA